MTTQPTRPQGQQVRRVPTPGMQQAPARPAQQPILAARPAPAALAQMAGGVAEDDAPDTYEAPYDAAPLDEVADETADDVNTEIAAPPKKPTAPKKPALPPNTVEFSKPYLAMGDEVTIVTFREPTGKEYRKIGPVQRYSADPDTGEMLLNVNMAAVALYVVALSNPPLQMSTVDQMSVRDVNACSRVINDFFNS